MLYTRKNITLKGNWIKEEEIIWKIKCQQRPPYDWNDWNALERQEKGDVADRRKTKRQIKE